MANFTFSNYVRGSSTSNYFGLYGEGFYSQSISGNYTDITVNLYIRYYSIDMWNAKSGTITINGTSTSFTKAAWSDYPSGGGGISLLGSATTRVYHNSDGTKTGVSISTSWTPEITYGGTYYSTLTASTTVNLPTIPRASSFTLSTSSVNVGSNITVNISRASSSFHHHVYFYIHGTSYTMTEIDNVGTSCTVTIPTSWLGSMPSSTSRTAHIRVGTFDSSNTQIGDYAYGTYTINVPSNIVPTVGTITLTPVAINGQNILVQGKNKLTVGVSGCSAGTGSSIKSYTFSGPGISSTTTSTSVSGGPISNTGTLTYTVQVTDNRNRTASKSATITCYAYTAPYFQSFTAYRSNSSGTADNNGTYIKCSYSLSYASVNSTNDVTVKIMYKKNSATSYSSVTSLTDSTATSGSQILSSIALDSTYTVYATITDNYSGSSSSQTITIFGAARVLNITSDGTGIAFGKMAESTKLLESRYRMKTPGLLSSRDGRTTTNINIAPDDEHLGCLESFIVKSGNTGVPSLGDGHIAHFHWDNTGGYDAQLYLQNTTGAIMSRGCNNGTWGNWNAVQYKPTTLYSTTTGNIGTITLSSSAANFTYLEIFYTDNNTRQPSSIKVYSPNGKYVSLSCIEPSTSGSEPRAYIRTSGWTISGTTMTPGRSDLSSANRGVYAQIYPHASGTNIDVNVTAQNYIKIFRVLGYA